MKLPTVKYYNERGIVMIRVLIADRVEINRVGFCSILGGLPKRVLIDHAGTQAELFERLQGFDYDLIVVEPAISDESGEELLRKIRHVALRTHILVLTMLTDLNFGFKAIRCGARGYLTKSCTNEELLCAVVAVASGRVHISNDLAELIAERRTDGVSIPSHEHLSDREFVVFSMLVVGVKVSQIAMALGVSAKTISTHKGRVLEKLQLRSISELVTYAISQGLIQECTIRSKAVIAKSVHRLNGDPRHKCALPEPAVGKDTGTNSSKVLRLIGRNRS